jgi:predicted N-acyltransferase
VGRRAGAEPRFVLVREAGRLVGAVPLYLKTNSYGEFIFDWSWANAAHRGRIPYYPKLVAAVPFTPATGRRLLVAPDADTQAVAGRLIEGMREVAEQERASSIHVLFCTEPELSLLAGYGLLPRLSVQFHWHNRPDRPYRDFDDYLTAFKSRHRKQVRRERKIAAAHGLTLKTLTGPDMSPRDWRALHDFYAANAAKHGGIEYLTPFFFEVIRTTYYHRVVTTMAYRDDVPIAGTFNFEKGRHIYGRYWGCEAEYQMLHFELCYHRLIERAIARGCTRFEAGAQGEHKLKRGLVPSFTHSAHWIRHPGLAAAVSDYIVAEAEAVREQATALQAESPFHAGAAGDEPDDDSPPPPPPPVP